MTSRQIVFRSTDTKTKPKQGAKPGRLQRPPPRFAPAPDDTDDTDQIDQDQVELTPEQAQQCWEAVQVAVAANKVIDAMLLQEIASKALAGEAMASANPTRARRRALQNYFGLPG